MEVIREIRTIYDNDKSLNTEILASSIRTPLHVKQAAMAGADIATVPPGVLRNIAKHPLTEKGWRPSSLTGVRQGKRSCDTRYQLDGRSRCCIGARF
jgi:transaldolase